MPEEERLPNGRGSGDGNNRRRPRVVYPSNGDDDASVTRRDCCELISRKNGRTRSMPFHFTWLVGVDAMKTACMYGHDVCFGSLCDMWPTRVARMPLDAPLCRIAAARGHYGCLKVAHDAGFEWDESATLAAAIGGSAECFRYAHRNGCPVPEYVTAVAAIRGRLEVFRYAHEAGCAVPEDVCRLAAVAGRVQIVRYAYHVGYRVPRDLCTWAAGNGHVDVLRYAREIGVGWDCWTAAFASLNGHRNCLRFAHRNGCRWNESAASFAVVGDSRACLRYAVENRCPLPDDLCAVAARPGREQCFRYLQQTGYRLPGLSALSAGNGRLECVRRVYENGSDWHMFTAIMPVRSAGGPIPVCVTYANARENPLGAMAVWRAAAEGRSSCLNFAVDRGSVWLGRGWFVIARRVERMV